MHSLCRLRSPPGNMSTRPGCGQEWRSKEQRGGRGGQHGPPGRGVGPRRAAWRPPLAAGDKCGFSGPQTDDRTTLQAAVIYPPAPTDQPRVHNLPGCRCASGSVPGSPASRSSAGPFASSAPCPLACSRSLSLCANCVTCTTDGHQMALVGHGQDSSFMRIFLIVDLSHVERRHRPYNNRGRIRIRQDLDDHVG